ncbi:TIGR01841 family phasin [Variovorax sp. J22R133]|uniref:TIGR01841 family phasin n=1 Tax=Variovorax brevis TaxID=3053503 RepID=UPI002574CA2E|nr:TIGR01841 family phasin [Variovorax sp. J22R133]MDM0111674.1 TIGR01841 family phasin [Variovorax sp. J22R133]
MATAKKATAKKAPAKKAAANGAAPKKLAAPLVDPMKAMEGMKEAFNKPMKGLTERLQNLKISGAASTIAESGRKDLEALIKANQKSFQGLQSVVKRQTEMLRESITDWQGAVKSMPGSDPKESIAKLDEMGRAAFKRALDDIRELADMAAKSQTEAFEIVRARITSNVDEVKKLLKLPGQ